MSDDGGIHTALLKQCQKSNSRLLIQMPLLNRTTQNCPMKSWRGCGSTGLEADKAAETELYLPRKLKK